MSKFKFKISSSTVGFWQSTTIILMLIIASQVLDIKIKLRFSPPISATQDNTSAKNANDVILSEGVVLPIRWGDLGKKMIADGVIDEAKFRSVFKEELTETEEQIFAGSWDKEIVLTTGNSRFVIDILWALGLSNKNEILQEDMMDKKYGGDAGKFASTGGWSLSKGSTMDHYNKHSYITLSREQQALLDEVSKNIYRPCCGNSVHFPDCNHGMAMLGLLELLASNDVGEDEMYSIALKVNSIWFPQTYLDLATYFDEQGTSWDQVDPKLALSAEYSSSRGYQTIRQKINNLSEPTSNGGGCGA